MNQQLYEALQVRFIKLRFSIFFTGDSILPTDKVSALRGGIGDVLLLMNCIRDRECVNCDFESECIVQRMMYSKFEYKPEFVTVGGSVGYVLECENYQERFKAGERLEFQLILFGKNIIYINQYVQALNIMGVQYGIGKYHAKFNIFNIYNMEGDSVWNGRFINMNKCHVHFLYDYILFWKVQHADEQLESLLIFDTPLTLKCQNEFLQEFQVEPIINAIKRRIYMLDCFEGISSDIQKYDNGNLPEILHQEYQLVSVSRYSTTKNEKMFLKGIKGYMQLSEISENIIDLLLIGELIHIGKNTSFGFGRYHIK